MEPEGSLPYSQAPATCPYPESQIIIIIIMCFRRFSDRGVPVAGVSRKLIFYEELSKWDPRPPPNLVGQGISLCPSPRSERVRYG